MKKLLLSLPFVSLVLYSCTGGTTADSYPDACYTWTFDSAKANVAQYVDPFIGTGGHGHTYPGATAPFGMVQLSPDTRIDGSWDGCSGYHHDDHRIYGFSHTHLSGTGCSDYGDIMLMPGHGEPQFTPGSDSTPGYSSTFSHDVEHASAGYYSVELDNKVLCEMTASPRVGVHRYSFNDNIDPWIVLDMSHRDEVLECDFEVVDDHTIRGKRFSRAWAQNQQLWFYAEFSEPFTYELYSDGKKFEADSAMPNDLKVVLSFTAQQVEVKVALSPVSSENAKMNLAVETSGMNFDAVKAKTEQHWNSELSRIEIETASEEKKTVFYTALYHCFVAPNVYCDVNGDYQGFDHKVYRDTVHQRYTVFSLWDTYRALHPLFTIVQQKRTNDFINTFLQIYKESGRLPVWELSSNETDCMIGYHSVSVITDAWMKGITGFDTVLAYEAMKASAMENRSGLEQYRKCGFIPAEGESESVSKTLEYAYDDWCIAQCGVRMNADGNKYLERSGNWRNLYNPATGFLQARLNNSFITPFNPSEVNFHYTEANAWQYSMAVQQDPMGLVEIMGGPEKFEAHLDSLFSVSSQTSGREQADITGLIGQYAQGNEPSHHMAYLYCYINKQWKTQELVHRICNDLYTTGPEGLCGNEDCGQMSAWYVLSSCGFYPVTPGKPEFVTGSPFFGSVKFHLENGNTFTFDCNGSEDIYLCTGTDTAEHNSGPHAGTISFHDIQNGLNLRHEKFKQPMKSCAVEEWPTYRHDDKPVTPWITGAVSRTFTDMARLEFQTLDKRDRIMYSINNSEFTAYSYPVAITENSTVQLYTYDRNYELGPTMGRTSDTATAHFFKAPAWKSIAIRNAYRPQYAAGGDRGLIDGLTGTTNFRTGLWQGYEGVDMDVVIDLGKTMPVDSVIANFLDDRGAWIFQPLEVKVYVGDDTTAMKLTGDQLTGVYAKEEARVIPIRTAGGTGRYVRVVATGQKVCPEGHPGEGKPAWLFADEITIKTK